MKRYRIFEPMALAVALSGAALMGCSQNHTTMDKDAANSASAEVAIVQKIDPNIEISYSQCLYAGRAPRVDVVREIELGSIVMPPFGQPLPDAPQLDRGRLGVWFFLGQRPTPGYSIQLNPELTRLDNGHLTLSIDQTTPDPTKRQAQSLTSPCALISINDISFIKLTIEGNIPGLPIGLALE